MHLQGSQKAAAGKMQHELCGAESAGVEEVRGQGFFTSRQGYAIFFQDWFSESLRQLMNILIFISSPSMPRPCDKTLLSSSSHAFLL